MENQVTPRVNLSRLRDIGFDLWDPIGILGVKGFFPGKWSDEKNERVADEYDDYLIEAAHKLRRGAPSETVVEYLFGVETVGMGLTGNTNQRDRAQAVVTAIKQDYLIWSWPDNNNRYK